MGIAIRGTLVAWVAAAPVQAASKSRQSASMKFTSAKPDHATGLRLEIDYVNPDDRDAKPRAVRELVEKLATGGRIDTSVPARCGASDAQLMAQGTDACPPDSRVGTGSLTFDTGFAGPARFVEVDVVFLNNTDELIFLSTIRGAGARVVTRTPVTRRAFKPSVPFLPGAPPEGAAIDTVEARLAAVERDGRSYLTTPQECPADGRWVNRIRFTYADGVSQKVRSKNRCRR